MKILKIITISLGVVASSFIYISCSKGAPDKISDVDTDFSNKTLAQIIVTTVNATRNYVYVDGVPVTGAPLISGSIFPSSGYGFNINGGVKSFLVKDTLPATTQVPFTFAENFQVSTHQTIFLYDTITTPKQKTVLDNIIVPADTSCRIRFANFIYNPSAVPAVDVYSFNRGANIFTNVPVTGVTDFIAYPSRLVIDTLYIRETGTQNLLIKAPISVLTPKRNYTFVYRGSHRGTKAASLYASY